MNRYRIVSPISDDSYAQILKGVHIENGNLVMIKQLKRKFYSWIDLLVLKEIKALKQLSHENIQCLKEIIFNNNELFLVFDYYEMNLFDYYQSLRTKGQKLKEEDIREIMQQILQGLHYMHTNGFFHRDLSLQNIFIKEVDDSSIEIRIGCFNTARETNGKPPLTDYVSTRFIRSPEQLLRISNYDCCIMVELFNMAPLFSGSDDVEQLTQLCRILGTPTNAEWPDFALLVQKMNIDMMSQQYNSTIRHYLNDISNAAYQLIKQLLIFNPQLRPFTHQLLNHPFFHTQSVQNGTLQSSSNDILQEQKEESDSGSDIQIQTNNQLKQQISKMEQLDNEQSQNSQEFKLPKLR